MNKNCLHKSYCAFHLKNCRKEKCELTKCKIEELFLLKKVKEQCFKYNIDYSKK